MKLSLADAVRRKMSNALEAGTKDSPPSSVEEGVAKGDQKLDVDGKLAGSTAPPDVSAKQAAHDGVGRNAGMSLPHMLRIVSRSKNSGRLH